jgi:hypothetical protein
MKTRTIYRFFGDNGEIYGSGDSSAEAVLDAENTIGEPLTSEDGTLNCGYVLEVEQEQDRDTGEWCDTDEGLTL